MMQIVESMVVAFEKEGNPLEQGSCERDVY